MVGFAPLALVSSVVINSPSAAAVGLREQFERLCIAPNSVEEIAAAASNELWIELAPASESDIPRIFAPDGHDFPTLVVALNKRTNETWATCTVYDPSVSREHLIKATSERFGDYQLMETGDDIAWVDTDGQPIVGREVRVSSFENESEQRVLALSVRKAL